MQYRAKRIRRVRPLYPRRPPVTYSFTLPYEAPYVLGYLAIGLVVALTMGGSGMALLMTAVFWPLVALWYFVGGLLKLAIMVIAVVLLVMLINRMRGN